jgi:hypothetical protein
MWRHHAMVDGNVRPFFRLSDYNPMSELVHLELTNRQRELLLRGLRYVRSSRMLEIRDNPDTIAEERRSELNEIRHLVEMLDHKAN